LSVEHRTSNVEWNRSEEGGTANLTNLANGRGGESDFAEPQIRWIRGVWKMVLLTADFDHFVEADISDAVGGDDGDGVFALFQLRLDLPSAGASGGL
jgi:hypothetical protein